jgi:TatD DNase family protein
MIIDTHAHLNFKAFNEDWDKVIDSCLAESVWMINVGSKYETSKKAVQIAEQYESGVYSAVGIHPIHAKEGFTFEEYEKLASSEKVIAIGEIGLDKAAEYGDFLEAQKQVLAQQIKLASKLRKPLIIHCRKAHEELLEVLKSTPRLPSVIHCFTGSWKQAQEYLDLGCFIGFNGIIFKLNLKEVIKKTPLNRILLETDCPFLTPPEAGVERNEPRFVRYVAKEIARIKEIPFEEVIKHATENAQILFGI